MAVQKEGAGLKHGNADGLSRRPYGGCKQSKCIEEWDGWPTWGDLSTKTTVPEPAIVNG